MFEKKLEGKVAIVTGSSRGIGKAISLEFARQGARVVVNGNSDMKGLSETAEEIRAVGCRSLPILADISNSSDVKKLVSTTMKEFGKIDILVNNAGIMKSAPIEELSEDDWDNVMNVNLKGAFLCSKYVGKQMIKQKRGVILNIASIAGLVPVVFAGSYSPSKAALISLTHLLALEWAKYNIRVNAICPGPVETELTNAEWPGKKRAARIKAIPLKRFGKPEEIAKAAVFLASDDSSYVTGHALVVDGGSVISMYHLVNLFISLPNLQNINESKH